ncbi:unnamed protein product [Caenorhabditis sp. 36 PRJEB53466]|nr:unnamed protein product [Caenorhabditis sp. 36 PRJEB53466]
MIKTTTTTATTTEDSQYSDYEYEYEEDIYKKVYNISTALNLYLEIFTVLNGLREVNPYTQAIYTLGDITKRVSVWLAILMALIRTLSVLFPMNNWISRVTKPKSAILTVLGVVLFWFVYSTWHFTTFRVFWLPDNLSQFCQNRPKNETEPRYVLAAPADLANLLSDLGFMEGVIKVLPATLYPILTIFLLIELRTIKKRRQNIKKGESDKSDNTTKLILFMTVTFMLSEGLAGAQDFLMYNFERISAWNEDLSYALMTAQYPITNLRSINAASHAFVCFLMSSQYRDTVKGMFCESVCCKVKRKVLKVEETRSTSMNSKTKSSF